MQHTFRTAFASSILVQAIPSNILNEGENIKKIGFSRPVGAYKYIDWRKSNLHSTDAFEAFYINTVDNHEISLINNADITI